MLIVALVLAPEALASLRAVKLDYSISSGVIKPIAVTANRGITFEVLPKNEYRLAGLALSLNRAIQAIEGLGASGDTIANLDFMNPFPALFLAPAPKGVWVDWDFTRRSRSVPTDTTSWQEVIGDACIVTEPKRPWVRPTANYSEPLVDVVKPHLASAFTLAYEDDLWRIWKNRDGCGATGGATPILAR